MWGLLAAGAAGVYYAMKGQKSEAAQATTASPKEPTPTPTVPLPPRSINDDGGGEIVESPPLTPAPAPTQPSSSVPQTLEPAPAPAPSPVPAPSPGLQLDVMPLDQYYNFVALMKNAAQTTAFAENVVLGMRKTEAYFKLAPIPPVCVQQMPTTITVQVPDDNFVRIQNVSTDEIETVAQGAPFGPGSWRILGPGMTTQTVQTMKCVKTA